MPVLGAGAAAPAQRSGERPAEPPAPRGQQLLDEAVEGDGLVPAALGVADDVAQELVDAGVELAGVALAQAAQLLLGGGEAGRQILVVAGPLGDPLLQALELGAGGGRRRLGPRHGGAQVGVQALVVPVAVAAPRRLALGALGAVA